MEKQLDIFDIAMKVSEINFLDSTPDYQVDRFEDEIKRSMRKYSI